MNRQEAIAELLSNADTLDNDRGGSGVSLFRDDFIEALKAPHI